MEIKNNLEYRLGKLEIDEDRLHNDMANRDSEDNTLYDSYHKYVVERKPKDVLTIYVDHIDEEGGMIEHDDIVKKNELNLREIVGGGSLCISCLLNLETGEWKGERMNMGEHSRHYNGVPEPVIKKFAPLIYNELIKMQIVPKEELIDWDVQCTQPYNNRWKRTETKTPNNISFLYELLD